MFVTHLDDETRTKRKYNRWLRQHDAFANDNQQTRLTEDEEARRKIEAEEARERDRERVRKEIGISPEGVALLECPRCESDKVYAPYPPDREAEFNWVSLRCRECKHQWKQTIRVQRDGKWLVLRWADGHGVRYLEM